MAEIKLREDRCKGCGLCVEMRGGTANCTVVISDQEIGSPIIHNPIPAIVMGLLP